MAKIPDVAPPHDIQLGQLSMIKQFRNKAVSWASVKGNKYVADEQGTTGGGWLGNL